MNVRAQESDVAAHACGGDKHDTDMSALLASRRLNYLDALVPRERLALHIS